MTSYKVAKGAVDLVGESYKKTQILLNKIEEIFIKNGGEPLETPVFERRDVLLGKYGEEADTKLIYNLDDEGGTPLALRYDLTIPFVRYIKENRIKKMRRYAIGKVYRRDQPNPNAGRYREFYQADFDIYGEKQDSMLAEATLLSMAAEVLKYLGVSYKILINDITNLKTLLVKNANVKEDIWRRYCPIIDKLDKQPFDTLRSELSTLDPELDLDRLKILLETKEPIEENSVKNYRILSEAAEIFGYKENLIYTNSLARGLDYYTGFIWEVKIDGFASSVIAGGRYDTLLGSSTVGISFGVSRLSSYIKINEEWTENTYITTLGNISPLEKLRVASLNCWSAGMSSDWISWI